jgi:CDP-diacylglycerol--glycerol-3-phosphate 3-phosphatidyltransferase
MHPFAVFAEACAPDGEPPQSRGLKLNLPNTLTLFRIFLVPFLVVVLLTKFDFREVLGLAIFWLAAITDFFDGWVARRRREVTRLGTLLDPIADKLLTSAAFISLVDLGVAPAWTVVVIVGREFAVSGLRSIAADRGILIPASPLKVQDVTQIAPSRPDRELVACTRPPRSPCIRSCSSPWHRRWTISRA